MAGSLRHEPLPPAMPPALVAACGAVRAPRSTRPGTAPPPAARPHSTPSGRFSSELVEAVVLQYSALRASHAQCQEGITKRDLIGLFPGDMSPTSVVTSTPLQSDAVGRPTG